MSFAPGYVAAKVAPYPLIESGVDTVVVTDWFPAVAAVAPLTDKWGLKHVFEVHQSGSDTSL